MNWVWKNEKKCKKVKKSEKRVQTWCLFQMSLAIAMASSHPDEEKAGIKMLLCWNIKQGYTDFLIYDRREPLRQK